MPTTWICEGRTFKSDGNNDDDDDDDDGIMLSRIYVDSYVGSEAGSMDPSCSTSSSSSNDTVSMGEAIQAVQEASRA